MQTTVENKRRTKASKVIKRWRTKSKLSLRETAERLSLSFGYLGQVERAERTFGRKSAQRIAKVIGCTWPELCE